MQENGKTSGGEHLGAIEVVSEAMLRSLLEQNRELLSQYPGIRTSIAKAKVERMVNEQGEAIHLFRGVRPMATSKSNILHRAVYLTEAEMNAENPDLRLCAIKEGIAGPDKFRFEKKGARRTQELISEFKRNSALKDVVRHINEPIHVLDKAILTDFRRGSIDLSGVTCPIKFTQALSGAMKAVFAFNTQGYILSDIKSENIYAFEENGATVGQLGDIYPYPAELYSEDTCRNGAPDERMSYTHGYFSRDSVKVYRGELHHFHIDNQALAAVIERDLIDNLIQLNDLGHEHEELILLLQECAGILRRRVKRDPGEELNLEASASINPLNEVIPKLDDYLDKLSTKQ